MTLHGEHGRSPINPAVTLSTVRCRILGQAEIHTKGIRLTPESELQFGLSLYFCANAGRELPRDDLAMLFWPKHSTDAGRHNLRQAIYRLRVLGLPIRNETRTTILDAHLVEADFAQVIGDGSPSAAFLRLTDVSVLPAYAPRLSRGFARWVEDFRTEVGGRLRRGLVRAISEMRARGRYADVERLCRFCLQLDPLNEEATLALAESVALAGGKAEAVGLIDRYAGEIGAYRPELRVPASLLRERISDRIMRRYHAPIDLPMIGREQDVERVMSGLQRLRGNRSVSYMIRGPSGIGKTRLALECCRIAELQGARLITVGTQPSSRAQALFAISALVNELLQLRGAIGCAPEALECLKQLSSPAAPRNQAFALDSEGEARYAMVRWSILDAFDAILAEGPLVVHIDDAHQIDLHSQTILQDALRTHVDRPLFLLFTMRLPESCDADRFGRLADLSVIHDLAPLSDDSCDRLVGCFCNSNDERLDAGTRERIIQLSAGNPLFLVELLKHRSDLVAAELPISVQALLEDRLSRLSPTALSVLRAAAVLGLRSTVERIHRMIKVPTSDILSALTDLHSAGLLATSGTAATCRHDTIREVVLDRAPSAVRHVLHRRAASSLSVEALQDGGVSLLWECVYHWRSAGVVQKGIQLALLLAKRLQALGLAQDALNVLEEVEQEAELAPDKKRIFVGQAKAARTLRDWGRLHNAIDKWFRECKQDGKTPRTHCGMELLNYEGQFYSVGHLPSTIINCVTSSSAPVAHRLRAATLAMIHSDNNGDIVCAHIVFERVNQISPKTKGAMIDLLTTGAIFHATFGDQPQAEGLLMKIVEEASSIAQPVVRSHHVRRAAFGLARFGDREFARSLLLQCLQTFERLRLPAAQALCVEELGLLAIVSGDVTESLKWIERAHTLAVELNMPMARAYEFELRIWLALTMQKTTFLPSFAFPDEIAAILSQSKRGRMSVLALVVLNSVLGGNAAAVVKQVEELKSIFDFMQARSDVDLAAAAVVMGCLANQQATVAAEVLDTYVNKTRRERIPAPNYLNQLLVDARS